MRRHTLLLASMAIGIGAWGLAAPTTQPARGKLAAPKLPPLVTPSTRPAAPRLPQAARYSAPATVPPLYVPSGGRSRSRDLGPAPALVTPPLANTSGTTQFPLIPPITRESQLQSDFAPSTDLQDPPDLLPTPVLDDSAPPTTRPATPPKPPMK